MMGMPGGWKPGSFWVRKVVQKPCGAGKAGAWALCSDFLGLSGNRSPLPALQGLRV